MLLFSVTRVAFLSTVVRSTATCAFLSRPAFASQFCTDTTGTSSLKMTMTPEKLIGATFDIVYASEQSKDTYRFDVKDDKKIAWKRIAGSDVGKGDTEDYVITQLNEETLLVTWIEADGLGLSNVLDFTKGTCLTHGNNGRSVWKHTGKLSLVETK